MRILILGEGPTDLGLFPEDEGTFDLEGPIPVLVRRLLEDKGIHTTLEFHPSLLRKIPRLNPGRKMRPADSISGFENKLRGLLGLPLGRGADAIIAVTDRDGEKHKDRILELNKGREHIQEAGKKCAVGVAIEMIEAWLLADEKALRSALENKNIQRQKDPEEIYASDESSNKHPKGLLNHLIHKSPKSDKSIPELFAEIARNIDLEVLIQRCPTGFAPFAQQVQELAG
jgi:hypothetical protein